MTNAAMHTIEHLFATYVRNTEFGDNIIYFGPMGCRTGFYFLTRSLSDNYSIKLIKEAFQFIADYWGVIPGASPKECGNCLDHNLPQAKEESKAFLHCLLLYIIYIYYILFPSCNRVIAIKVFKL